MDVSSVSYGMNAGSRAMLTRAMTGISQVYLCDELANPHANTRMSECMVYMPPLTEQARITHYASALARHDNAVLQPLELYIMGAMGGTVVGDLL